MKALYTEEEIAVLRVRAQFKRREAEQIIEPVISAAKAPPGPAPKAAKCRGRPADLPCGRRRAGA